MKNRPALYLTLTLSVISIPAGLYYQYLWHDGTIGLTDVALYALIILGSLGLVYTVTFLFFPQKYQEAPVKFNYFFMSTLFIASPLIVGSNMMKMGKQIDELEQFPTFTRGIIIDAQEKGKQHEPWKIFSFSYNGKDYTGEFRDPYLKLFVGDSITVKHSSKHPQYNLAVVDTIYNEHK